MIIRFLYLLLSITLHNIAEINASQSVEHNQRNVQYSRPYSQSFSDDEKQPAPTALSQEVRNQKLREAVQQNNLANAQHFILYSADPTQIKASGETLPFIAWQKGYDQILDELLRAGGQTTATFEGNFIDITTTPSPYQKIRTVIKAWIDEGKPTEILYRPQGASRSKPPAIESKPSFPSRAQNYTGLTPEEQDILDDNQVDQDFQKTQFCIIF